MSDRPRGAWSTGLALFDAWWARVTSTEPEFRYHVGTGYQHVDVAPGKIVALIGRPGVGKSGLLSQWTVDLAEAHPDTRILIVNPEMPVHRLLDRMLAYVGQLDLTSIYARTATRLEKARDRIAALLETERLAFVTSGWDMETIHDAGEDTGAGVLTVDYLQRIDLHTSESEVGRINRLMQAFRDLVTPDVAAILLSSASRQRDISGNASYANLGLASGRGSSEIEFCSDSVYALVDSDGRSQLVCLKDKYGVEKSIEVHKDLTRMTFIAGGPFDPQECDVPDTRPKRRKGKSPRVSARTAAAIDAAWGSTHE